MPTRQPASDQRIFVQSSELRWVQYDVKSSLLTAEFHSGEIYQYQRVAKSKFNALLAAESKGRYFNANIRGRYDFLRIS